MNVVALVAVVETGGDNEVDRILAQVGAIPCDYIIGVVVIPAAVLVPPFACVAGELFRLLSVYNEKEVDFALGAEGVLVVVVAFINHRRSRIACLLVLGQAVPVVD